MNRPRHHYSKLSKERDVMAEVLQIHTNVESSGEAVGLAGIDTRKDTHHVAVIDEFGRPVIDQAFSASAAGYGKVVDLFTRLGHVVKVGVEGTGAYGAGIARALTLEDRKSTRLNSSHVSISYAVFGLKEKRRSDGGDGLC